MMAELSIIQKTYDLIKWYVPILNKFPKAHKFTLANRLIERLYDFLEGLIKARYSQSKLTQLQDLNTQLDIIRYHTRLCLDFQLISVDRYQYVSQLTDEIGLELGKWIKQQRHH
jgi:hypothetical protein